MQGQHEYQGELFSVVDHDKLFPKSHILRKINTQVDFSFIREMTKNLYDTKVGRPSINPEIYFRIIIIGHLFGIQSDRKLCEEIGLHLGYRWFCRLNR